MTMKMKVGLRWNKNYIIPEVKQKLPSKCLYPQYNCHTATALSIMLGSSSYNYISGVGTTADLI